MNFLLSDIAPTQWILLAVILVLIVLYPVFIFIRNKKDKEKFAELNSALKEGDKVLTSSGVYGTVVSMTETAQGKLVTLETGDEKHKGYISVDVLAIYTVVKEPAEEVMPVEAPAVVEEVKPEPKEETIEAPKPKKKTVTKKTTTAKK